MDLRKLHKRLASYVDLCQRIAQELGSPGSPIRQIIPPRRIPGEIAARANRSKEFERLTVGSWKDDYLANRDPENLGLGFQASRHEFSAFLRRSRFYHDIADGKEVSVEELAQRFSAVPKDGFSVLVQLWGVKASREAIDLPGCRLWTPDVKELEDWFEVHTIEAFQEQIKHYPYVGRSQVQRLTGFTFLERVHEEEAAPNDMQRIRTRKEVHPWLSYLQLLSQRNPITTGQTFVKWHSPRRFPLLFSPEFGFGPETRSTYGSETLVRLEDADQAKQLLVGLNQCHEGAGTKTPRIDRALRAFGRACEYLEPEMWNEWESSLLLSDEPFDDHVERAFLDLVVVMESVFLESKKTFDTQSKLAERASCLLAESDKDIANLNERIRRVYRLRSELVHADVSPGLSDLIDATLSLYEWTRRSLLALLLLLGDRAPIIDGVRNPAVRDANRRRFGQLLRFGGSSE